MNITVLSECCDAEVRHRYCAKCGQECRIQAFCEHGTAMDVHCCNCHSGFLFDSDSCVCEFDTEVAAKEPEPQ